MLPDHALTHCLANALVSSSWTNIVRQCPSSLGSCDVTWLSTGQSIEGHMMSNDSTQNSLHWVMWCQMTLHRTISRGHVMSHDSHVLICVVHVNIPQDNLHSSSGTINPCVSTLCLPCVTWHNCMCEGWGQGATVWQMNAPDISFVTYPSPSPHTLPCVDPLLTLCLQMNRSFLVY